LHGQRGLRFALAFSCVGPVGSIYKINQAKILKTALKISIGLNLGLLGGLLYFIANQHSGENAGMTSAADPPAIVAAQATPPTAREIPRPFHWSQLVSSNDYRLFIANLRAIGCPEPTIRNIVTGDAEHAFAFKRAQLRLDGSGNGTWSRSHEARLVADLLGEQPVGTENITLAQNGENAAQTMNKSQPENAQASPEMQRESAQQRLTTFARPANPVYPLAFRQVDLAALGFGAAEKTAIDQVRQQFANDIGGADQNPEDPAYLARWQTAQANADEALRGALGSQEFMAFQIQQYYDWYQPKITAAQANGRTVAIDPELFSKGK